MGGGTTTSNTTSNQINQIPQWISDAGQQNYAYAQNVAQQPLQQYQGQMVADVAPQTQQGWDVAANSGNVGSDQFNAATAGYLNAIGQTPTSINPTGYNATGYNSTDYAARGYNAAQTGSSNLGQYMNPYTSSVINATLPIMQQQLGLNQNAQQNAASSANAFGGSRQGIQQGVTQAQGAMDMTQMAAQLNMANYNQARQASEFDVGAQNTAAQWNAGAQNTAAAANAAAANTAGQWNAGAANTAGQWNAGAANTAAAQNQAADQAKINSDILASQGLTNTGQQMNTSNVANFNMLQSAGAGESMQQQNQINAQMAKFNQAFNYPQQQLGILESSLGMTPHDTSTSGQSNTTTTTPTDWANLIAKGAQTAGSLYGMSDKSMKTDITKLGKDPDTKLPMYAYRYKGDPKHYPKVVGPMAQDVQKVAPDMVRPMGKDGKLAIRGYAGGTSDVQSMSDANRQGRDDEKRRLAYGADPARSLRQTPDEERAYDAEIDRIIKAGSIPDYGPISRPPGYAAGTPYVPPSLAAFTPPSSPGVAKGIGALSAFKPQTRLPRGVGVGKVQRFDEGTADVQPFDPQKAKVTKGLKDIGDIWGSDDAAPGAAPSEAPPKTTGWGAPSMGYFQTGYARGVSAVPGMGQEDTVPAMLTPGEAVLTPGAAQHLGRHNIAALNAFMPPVRSRATSAPRAGARGIHGALANTKVRPKVMGGLSG